MKNRNIDGAGVEFHSLMDAIDHKAEREAQALAWFEEELGMPEDLPLLVRRQRQQIVFTHCRYPMAASLRTNDKLQRATAAQLAAWNVSAKFDICTAEDRARRSLNKQRKLLLARKIESCGQKVIPFDYAMKIGQVSARALHRAIQHGKVLGTKQRGQAMVDVASFRAYTAKRPIYAKAS